MWKYNLVFLIFLFVSCKNSNSNFLANNIKITISADTSTILFENLDKHALYDISADSLSTKQWENIIAVYPKVDDDLQDLQNPLKGDYQILNDKITFTPQNPLKKQSYLVEIYIEELNDQTWDIIKKSNSPFVKHPIKKIITLR